MSVGHQLRRTRLKSSDSEIFSLVVSIHLDSVRVVAGVIRPDPGRCHVAAHVPSERTGQREGGHDVAVGVDNLQYSTVQYSTVQYSVKVDMM